MMMPRRTYFRKQDGRSTSGNTPGGTSDNMPGTSQSEPASARDEPIGSLRPRQAANGRTPYKEPTAAALSLLWSCPAVSAGLRGLCGAVRGRCGAAGGSAGDRTIGRAIGRAGWASRLPPGLA